MIDEAVCGVAPIDITGSSDVDLSATVNNGSSDDARHMVLRLTGTIGADIDLIVPALEKIYIIDAAWSGDFTVTIKPVGAPSGADFETGQKGWVYTNGTSIQSLLGLLAVNNLSDLTDIAAARDNLDLGNLAVLDAGTGLVIVGNTLTAPTASTSIIGEIRMWSTASAPAAWLFCDGSAVSRATYVNLFNLIGVTYGPGNGTTTFNLPDFRGRMPIGAGQGNTAEGGGAGTTRILAVAGGKEAHTLLVGELAAHFHAAGTLAITQPVSTNVRFGNNNDGVSVAGTQRLYAPSAGTLSMTVGRSGDIIVDSDGTIDTSGAVSGQTGTSAAAVGHPIMNPFLTVNFIIHTGL